MIAIGGLAVNSLVGLVLTGSFHLYTPEDPQATVRTQSGLHYVVHDGENDTQEVSVLGLGGLVIDTRTQSDTLVDLVLIPGTSAVAGLSEDRNIYHYTVVDGEISKDGPVEVVPWVNDDVTSLAVTDDAYWVCSTTASGSVLHYKENGYNWVDYPMLIDGQSTQCTDINADATGANSIYGASTPPGVTAVAQYHDHHAGDGILRKDLTGILDHELSVVGADQFVYVSGYLGGMTNQWKFVGYNPTGDETVAIEDVEFTHLSSFAIPSAWRHIVTGSGTAPVQTHPVENPTDYPINVMKIWQTFHGSQATSSDGETINEEEVPEKPLVIEEEPEEGGLDSLNDGQFWE